MITPFSFISKQNLAGKVKFQDVYEEALKNFAPSQCICLTCRSAGHCIGYGGYFRLVETNGMFRGTKFSGRPGKTKEGALRIIPSPTLPDLKKGNLTNDDGRIWLHVRRVLCLNCLAVSNRHVTHAILPSFLVPFQPYLLVDLVTVMASFATVWYDMAEVEATKKNIVILEETNIKVTSGK